MWKDWINGILGLWVVLLAFIGIPFNAKAILMIITGLAIAFLSFWKGASDKVKKEISTPVESQEINTEDGEIV